MTAFRLEAPAGNAIDRILEFDMPARFTPDAENKVHKFGDSSRKPAYITGQFSLPPYLTG